MRPETEGLAFVPWWSEFHPPSPGPSHQRRRTDALVSVGKSLVAALRHPEQSYGRALKVQSFVVTPKEVLDEYQRQTGAEWAVSYTSLERLKEVESQLWADGVPAATGATLRRIWAEGGTLYERNDNELLGLAGELESLETAVRRAITEARERQ